MKDRKENTGSDNNEKTNSLMDWQGQFEAVFSCLPVGISYLTPDMRYIRINPFLEEKTGQKSDEIVGKFCYEANGMYKDDPTRSGREKICDPCGIVKALETGEPFKFTRKNNENFIVENMGVPIKDVNGKILGLVEIIVDITERVRMEERLQQHASQLEAAVEEKTRELYKSKTLLDNIIQGTTDAIFTLDGKGRFCYMNSAVEEVFGYPGAELFEKPLTDILLAADKEKVKQALGLLNGKEAPLHNLKLVIKSGDGIEKYLLLSLTPLSEVGGANRFVGVCKDISREKKLEQEKEDFITMLTHDLKTPLTSVIGYSSIILDNEAGSINDDVKSSVEGVLVNAQRMLGLVRNFLSAGKIKDNKLRLEAAPMRLESLVLESLNNMRPILRDKKIEVEVNFTGNLPDVTIDKEHMERVLCNLVSNAARFTPEGGRISVKASDAGDGYIRLEISDTGSGIPENEIPMLFDKYYQGRNSSKGTGLGLFIVKNIVEAHQGDIQVSSLIGKGTTFTIKIPKDF